jgi:oligoendopeptidase F
MTWDLTTYFPAFNGAEMLQFKEAIRKDVAVMQRAAASLPVLDSASAADWEALFLQHEDIMRRMSHLGSYVGCLASSDARNEAYLKE